MTLHVACIVEGHGEQKCLPRLLHRIWGELLSAPELLRVLEPPFFKHRGNILKPEDLAGYVDQAILKLQHQARKDAAARLLLLMLIDSEGTCPATVVPPLLAQAKAARTDADIACVMPHPMFETWFAAAASSLAGVNDLPADLTTPANPEDNGLGKGWLKKQLSRKYIEPVDQLRFTASMDLALCRQNSPSFDKLCRELEQRLSPAPTPAPPPAAQVQPPPTEQGST